ncbi:ThiF family adenylyltransferase [Paenibacillus spongiae]|uniref:ThiF family adenylyltransferase n=1 Tax=Paenibacillus spongiae TaxID=2909671 RepID=A0ABY5SHY7_9BACL|nr:ThiF family adenylyltransferase [Paenibacillus spongiae]UVI31858.1 ThiF family adenylyltransferase [Paenibacillus spongiae]
MYHSSHSALGAGADDRYSRQTRFAPIGQEGQRGLSSSCAVIVGMGALGSVIAQHLVRSGVGRVRIIDRDVLELSNLQRQVLYTEEDVRDALPKAEAAAARLRAINSSVSIESAVADLTPVNADTLLAGADLILDGSDNFSVRYLINDYSLKHHIPWIYGGVIGASGMTMTYIPGETACFRCLFPNPPATGAVDTCDTAGVISPAVDIIASLQATEAIKWLSGNRDALHGTLFQIDLWQHRWMPLKTEGSKKADCPACGQHKFTFLEDNRLEPAAVSLCGRNTIQITPQSELVISLAELEKRLSRIGRVERNPFLLRYYRDDQHMVVIFPDGRAFIQGTEDSIAARRIYTEILGS